MANSRFPIPDDRFHDFKIPPPPINTLRHAFRRLARAPGFTCIAVLTLALGISAAATLFSVLRALVLDPFPYPDAAQIAYVRSNTGQPLSAPDFRDIREQNSSFAEFGVYTPLRLNLGGERPESVSAIQCTTGVLRAFGIKPALGRWLDDSDEVPGAAPVAVISHAFWTRALNANPAVIGSTVHFDGRSTEIVGVMPADFEFSSPWYQGSDFEAWTPLRFEGEPASDRGSHWLLGLARLKPGVTIASADAEIKTIGANLTRQYPDSNTGKPMLVRSIRDEIARDTATGMKPLTWAVALLMLVACANVAGLLLARGMQRQSEYGIRLALGASRAVLARQPLTEAVLLGLLGGAGGVILALWGTTAVRQLIPAALIIEARRAAITIDAEILLFAVILGLASAMAAALIPAFAAAHSTVATTLNESGRSQTGSRVRRRFLCLLVMAQTALTVVLAYTGILCAASYANVFRSNRSLDTDQVLTAEISLQGERYRDVAARVRFWRSLIERVQTLPGAGFDRRSRSPGRDRRGDSGRARRRSSGPPCRCGRAPARGTAEPERGHGVEQFENREIENLEIADAPDAHLSDHRFPMTDFMMTDFTISQIP